MPGGFHEDRSVCNGRAYGTVQTSYTFGGTAVAPSATANTKGSWVQLIASTVGDTCELDVCIRGQSNTVWMEQLVDIGIGAAGSEQVIASNLIYGLTGQYAHACAIYRLPINIPAGTRIAARSQADVATVGGDMQVSILCFDGAFLAPHAAGMEAIGVSTTTSRGTAVTPGNGVKGSYAQLTASTSRDYCGLTIAIDSQANGNADAHNVDVAIGASGSEQIILPDLFYTLTNHNVWGPFMIDLPAGTRIAARACDLAGVVSVIGITVYGIYR